MYIIVQYMHDVKKYWDQCYESGRDFRFLSHQSITRFLHSIKQDTYKVCLDIGCGTGQLTRELSHRGYECVGIDVSSKAIDIASSLTNSQRIKYVCADIESYKNDLQMQKQEYSLVTCKYVYAFIKNKPQFLSGIYDLLKEDGTFVVITPLLTDVPPEKSEIAVDFDRTIAELGRLFKVVETYAERDATSFLCIKR